MSRTILVWANVLFWTWATVVLFAEFPLVIVWGTMIVWNLVMVLLFGFSLVVYLRRRRDVSALGEFANGRRIVAEGRLRFSEWLLNVAGLLMSAGWVGAYRLTLPDLNSPLALLLGAATRNLVIIAGVCLLLAKLADFTLYEKTKRFYRARLR